MKRKLLTALALAGLALSGASGAASYKPGTYTAEAQGMGGPVPVTVELTSEKIQSVKVGENKETDGIGTVAIERLPGAIVDGQSLGVSAVSGASVTSGAILAAVAACVREAGGDVEALKTVQPKKATGEPKTLESDIVVVGAGAAGRTAAIRASELGARVILVEKQPFEGGAAAVNGGGIVTQGSKIQKELGVTDDSPALMTEDFIKNGHNLNDRRMLKLYADHLGETVDWALSYAGMRLDAKAGFSHSAEYSRPRVLYWVGRAQGANRMLHDAVEKAGAEVLLETPVQKLIVEDGRVVGVEALGAGGTPYTVRSKAVILATGGFGANKAMLSGQLRNALYYGVPCANGDGHRMAMEIGAATRNMDLGKVYPNGIEVAPGLAKSTIFASGEAYQNHSGILVSKAGVRVISELETNHNLKEAVVREGGRLFILMDQKTFDAFLGKVWIGGISGKDMDRWLANEGRGAPTVGRGDTIGAAAAKAGIDGKALASTAKKYNEFVRSGKDADFGRPAKFMKAEISAAGPYYIVEQQPRFATTLGGVVTTESLQVVDKEGRPIGGLFAAGEIVGGPMGDDSPPGGNMGWALTSGKLAAESAVRTLK